MEWIMSKREKVGSYSSGNLTKGLLFECLFDTADPKKWAVPTPNKKSKKSKKDESKGSHDATNAKRSAILHKNNEYKKNFSAYIKTDSDRNKVYNTISPNIKKLYAKDRPLLITLFDEYFKMDSFECYFNTEAVLQKGDSITGKRRTSGCSKPYDWEAHHIIPGEAFTIMEKTKGGESEVFSPLQYEILSISDYDINHGHNIIALPGNSMDPFQPVHNLIQHPSNHSEYTSYVIKEMKKLKTDLDEYEEDMKEDHPKFSVIIADSLRDKEMTEDILWEILIKIGEAVITAKVTKTKIELTKEEQGLVKYDAKTTDTKYKYGALK
jgi:hypothetical protein